MADVVFNEVDKVYDNGFHAVHSLSLDIEDGEFLVLVGPSGCGKTTALRMVAGLEEITGGELMIGDRVVNSLSPKERDIAMVFQNYALYPHMSVYDNMAYGLKVRGAGKREIRTRVEGAAQILELQALLGRKPGQLSGGQRQRVAMGRAIVREPAVFLFDEPLSNLDAKLRVQMRSEIGRLHARLGTTSLYVTHDQVEAMTLADRAIVLDEGDVEQIGTPNDIYDRPATLFVAGFVGSPPMNLFAGRVSTGGDAFAVDGGPSLPLDRRFAAQAGAELVLGIRPEHLQPAGAVTGGAVAHAELAVDYCERLGAENLAYGRWGTQQVVVRLPHERVPSEGEKLTLNARASFIHLFDPATRKRVEP